VPAATLSASSLLKKAPRLTLFATRGGAKSVAAGTFAPVDGASRDGADAYFAVRGACFVTAAADSGAGRR